jgi:hypothetical protein
MPYSLSGYTARAEECVRLANNTNDAMISAELLKLRQTYLKIADQLGEMEERNVPPEPGR